MSQNGQTQHFKIVSHLGILQDNKHWDISQRNCISDTSKNEENYNIAIKLNNIENWCNTDVLYLQ